VALIPSLNNVQKPISITQYDHNVGVADRVKNKASTRQDGNSIQIGVNIFHCKPILMLFASTLLLTSARKEDVSRGGEETGPLAPGGKPHLII
jgi:hypothetical protein